MRKFWRVRAWLVTGPLGSCRASLPRICSRALGPQSSRVARISKTEKKPFCVTKVHGVEITTLGDKVLVFPEEVFFAPSFPKFWRMHPTAFSKIGRSPIWRMAHGSCFGTFTLSCVLPSVFKFWGSDPVRYRSRLGNMFLTPENSN